MVLGKCVHCESSLYAYLCEICDLNQAHACPSCHGELKHDVLDANKVCRFDPEIRTDGGKASKVKDLALAADLRFHGRGYWG